MLRDSTVAAVVRTRPRATPLVMITMKNSTHGFLFVSHIWDAYGAPHGGPSGLRSCDNTQVLVHFSGLVSYRQFAQNFNLSKLILRQPGPEYSR